MYTCILNFYFVSVAVLACFVTFRTPLHIEKAIFVITTLTQKWDENMIYYHGILKLIAGKYMVFCILGISITSDRDKYVVLHQFSKLFVTLDKIF